MLLFALIVIGLLSLTFVGSLVVAIRRPQQVRRLYDDVPWARVKLWVWGLTLAAVAGAALGGAGETVLAAIAAAGYVGGFVCGRFADSAHWNRLSR